MNLAVIPARGGSKRIPRKNIREFCGKPIIAYSIEAALESGSFARVIVSTDDEEVASIARSLGAETPFLRPPELSDDHTPTMPVIRHAVDWVSENMGPVEYACCLYATAPFIRAEFIRQGLAALKSDSEIEFAFSVTSYAFPIFRSLKIRPGDGRVEMLFPDYEVTRSQDLPEAFHDAGQFYWGAASAFRRAGGFFSARSLPVILPRFLVQDIDTPEDWRHAEFLYEVVKSTCGYQ